MLVDWRRRRRRLGDVILLHSFLVFTSDKVVLKANQTDVIESPTINKRQTVMELEDINMLFQRQSASAQVTARCSSNDSQLVHK